MSRVAVLDKSRCVNGTACDFVCGKVCPVNRAGKECIVLGNADSQHAGAKSKSHSSGHGQKHGAKGHKVDVSVLISDEQMRMSKPVISEELCIGCNICVQKCPVDCIRIENLVQELKEPPVHRFGKNAFRVYRLPTVKKGGVVGVIGRNGIGKSTIMKILSGQIIPNLGDYGKANGGDYSEVIKFFRGKELQKFFTDLHSAKARVSIKPQGISEIPKFFSGEVKGLLEKAAGGKGIDFFVEHLNLQKILDRNLADLSGGELQRVAIAATCIKDADFYSFDEPTSFLDIRERLNSAKAIRWLAESGGSVMVVEHDLAVLDYLSDYVNILYGKKSAYGIVSNPKSVRNGINEFLEGYVKDENVRFRKEELKFEARPPVDLKKRKPVATYPGIRKRLGSFSFEAESGDFCEGEVLGIMGPNGIGKTTFVKMLAGLEKPDWGKLDFKLRVSYKPQYLSIVDEDKVLSVEAFIAKQGLDMQIFMNAVDRRLEITELNHHKVGELSGGELQKLVVGIALSRSNFDLLLLDEPTAFVDVEDRLNLADAIRSVVSSQKKICMVVDHDILFQDYVSDRLVVFDGEPSVKGFARGAMPMREGMNHFLKGMGITFRRDPETGRPRANKPGSQLDQEQKKKGEYYYVA